MEKIINSLISDNTSIACPEVIEFLTSANTDISTSYGTDNWTQSVTTEICEIFEKKVSVFFVVTGTAANALALSSFTPPFGKVYCHELSHLNTDECGAPEMFTGGAKLIDMKGDEGRINADILRETIYGSGNVHHAQPSAVSITQACESGTVYNLNEIESIASVARENNLPLHMDGARFANALVSLNVTPAQMTWRVGVDVLSFGATKNGCIAAEAVIFFNEDLAANFPFLQKRAGHLLSKSRFIAAQFQGYLSNDVWLKNARNANHMAKRFSNGIASLPGVDLAYPTQSNEIFVKMPKNIVDSLAKDGIFVNDEELDGKAVRFVTSWNTTELEVDQLLDILNKHCVENA